MILAIEITQLTKDRKHLMEEGEATINLVKIRDQYQNLKNDRDAKRRELEGADKAYGIGHTPVYAFPEFRGNKEGRTKKD